MTWPVDSSQVRQLALFVLQRGSLTVSFILALLQQVFQSFAELRGGFTMKGDHTLDTNFDVLNGVVQVDDTVLILLNLSFGFPAPLTALRSALRSSYYLVARKSG